MNDIRQEFEDRVLDIFKVQSSDNNLRNNSLISDSIKKYLYFYLSYCEISCESPLKKDPLLILREPSQDLETLIKNNIQKLLERHSLANSLEIIQPFEDNIFSGPLGFFVGLYYFLKIYQGSNSEQISTRLKYSFSLPNIQDWNARLPYLRPFGVIRFQEDQLNELLGEFWDLSSST